MHMQRPVSQFASYQLAELAKLVTWPVIAPRSTYFKVTRPG